MKLGPAALAACILVLCVIAILGPGARRVEAFGSVSARDHLYAGCAPHAYPDLINLQSVVDVKAETRPFKRTSVFRSFFSTHSTPLFTHTVHGRSSLTACISKTHPQSRFFTHGAAHEARVPAAIRRLLYLGHMSFAELMLRVFAGMPKRVKNELHVQVRASFDHNALYALLQRLLVFTVVESNASLMAKLDSVDSVVAKLRGDVQSAVRDTGIAKGSAEALASEVQSLQSRLACSDMAAQALVADGRREAQRAEAVRSAMRRRNCPNIPTKAQPMADPSAALRASQAARRSQIAKLFKQTRFTAFRSRR